jgi:hypothetical protein
MTKEMTEDSIVVTKLITTIPKFTSMPSFKTSTQQLLDALTVALTDTGAKSPVVSLSLKEYMAKMGLKDEREARKQVVNDLNVLYNAEISFKDKRENRQEQDFFDDIRIICDKGIEKGVITVSFGTAFYHILIQELRNNKRRVR